MFDDGTKKKKPPVDDIDRQMREMGMIRDASSDTASERSAIERGAADLGVDPIDYATAISYESAGSFDPWRAGPITKWGQHRGTIQYGEPQRKQYGVYQGQSFEDQVTTSNVKYLKDAGVRPGMTFAQIYAAIDGGSVNKDLNTLEPNTGRTIADNIRIAQNEHRPKVLKRFGWQDGGSQAPSSFDFDSFAADLLGNTTTKSAVSDTPASFDFDQFSAQIVGKSESPVLRPVSDNTPLSTAGKPSMRPEDIGKKPVLPGTAPTPTFPNQQQPLKIGPPQGVTAEQAVTIPDGRQNIEPSLEISIDPNIAEVKQNESVVVVRTQDNADGTTTNFLTDGTTSTVRYTRNADGSLTAVEVDSPKPQVAEEVLPPEARGIQTLGGTKTVPVSQPQVQGGGVKTGEIPSVRRKPVGPALSKPSSSLPSVAQRPVTEEDYQAYFQEHPDLIDNPDNRAALQFSGILSKYQDNSGKTPQSGDVIFDTDYNDPAVQAAIAAQNAEGNEPNLEYMKPTPDGGSGYVPKTVVGQPTDSLKGIAYVYQSKEGMSEKEAARSAFENAARANGVTASFDQYLKTRQGKALFPTGYQEGDNIQVDYQTLKDGGADIETDLRIEQTQDRDKIQPSPNAGEFQGQYTPYQEITLPDGRVTYEQGESIRSEGIPSFGEFVDQILGDRNEDNTLTERRKAQIQARQTFTEEDKAQNEEIAKNIRIGAQGVEGNVVAGGFLTGAEFLLALSAGINDFMPAQYLPSHILTNGVSQAIWGKDTADVQGKIANRLQNINELSTPTDKVLKFSRTVGNVAGALPAYVIVGIATRNPVVTFAATDALIAKGKGGSTQDVVKAGAKGAALGFAFGGFTRFGKGAADAILGEAALPSIIGKDVARKTVEATAIRRIQAALRIIERDTTMAGESKAAQTLVDRELSKSGMTLAEILNNGKSVPVGLREKIVNILENASGRVVARKIIEQGVPVGVASGMGYGMVKAEGGSDEDALTQALLFGAMQGLSSIFHKEPNEKFTAEEVKKADGATMRVPDDKGKPRDLMLSDDNGKIRITDVTGKTPPDMVQSVVLPEPPPKPKGSSPFLDATKITDEDIAEAKTDTLKTLDNIPIVGTNVEKGKVRLQPLVVEEQVESEKKEPWQVTVSESVKKAIDTLDPNKRYSVQTQKWRENSSTGAEIKARQDYDNWLSIDTHIGQGAATIWSKYDDHKEVVEQAIKDGKPVPPAVLAEYPDLAASAVKDSLTTEPDLSTTEGRYAASKAEQGKPTAKSKLPPHLQRIVDKTKGFEITDVTPPGYGPEDATGDSYYRQKGENVSLEEQRLQTSINEGKTLLKGSLSPEKKEQIEKSIASSQSKLDAMQVGKKPIQPSAQEIDQDYVAKPTNEISPQPADVGDKTRDEYKTVLKNNKSWELPQSKFIEALRGIESPDIQAVFDRDNHAKDWQDSHKDDIEAVLKSGDLTPARAKELGHFEAYPDLAKKYDEPSDREVVRVPDESDEAFESRQQYAKWSAGELQLIKEKAGGNDWYVAQRDVPRYEGQHRFTKQEYANIEKEYAAQHGERPKVLFTKKSDAATAPIPATDLQAGDRVANGNYKGTVFEAKDGTLKIERTTGQIHPLTKAWQKTKAQVAFDKKQAQLAKKGKRKDELESDNLGDPGTSVLRTKPSLREPEDTPPDPIGFENESVADDEAHARALIEVRMPLELEPQAGFEKSKVSHVDVVKAYEKILRNLGRPTPVRLGRMAEKNARGIYKPGAEVIRLREAGNIPTAAHEIFHGVQKVMFGAANAGALKPIPKVALRELVQLGKDLYGTTRPSGGYRSEGFAEFGRTYLTQGTARLKAPVMYHYFVTEFLPNNPAFAKGLKKAKEITTAYQMEGAANRASANMSRVSIKQRLEGIYKSLKSQFSTQVIDELTPLLNLSKDVEKLSGVKLSPGENPGMVASYLRGNAQAKTHYMVFDGMIDAAGNKVGPPLADAVAKIRRRQADFVHYLWAKRALERWSVNKNPGMSKEDAAFLVEQLASPEFEMAAHGVYEWNAGVLNYVKGMLPDLAPTVDLILETSTNYVPLMREMSDVEAGGLAGKYEGFGGNAMFQMKGSGRRIKNIFPQMIANAERMLTMAHKRKVLDTIARLEGLEGVGSLLEKVPRNQVPNTVTIQAIEKSLIEAGADLKDVDLDEAVTFFTPAKFPKGADPIVPIMKDGKMEWYQVPADLYNALSGLDLYRLPKVADLLLGAPTRLFRLGTTGLRASFGLFTNPARDIQTVFVQSQSKNPAKLMLNYFKALGAAINPKRLTGENNAALDTFYRLGVNLAQPLGVDEAVTTKFANQVFQSRPRRIMTSPINALREVFSISESVPRVAELETIGREIGWTPGDSLTFDQAVQMGLAGKQSTVDFSASGKAGKVVNQMVPFFNANVQGTRSFSRAFKRNPAGTILKGLAAIALPTLLLWWKNKDEEWYTDMPDREKNMYWNIQSGDNIIQIPRAQEWGGLFATLPESIADSWYKKDPEGFKASLGYLFDLATPPVEPIPVKVGHEQWANRIEFFDKPIVPRAEEDLPPSEQYGEYTSEVAKWLGKNLPDSKIAGIPINSPRRIDAAIRSIGGGVASDITQVTNTKSPKDWQPTDWPVIGRAFRRGGTVGTGSKIVDKFYDELTKARQIKASKERDEAPEENHHRRQLEDASDALAKLRKIAPTVDAAKKIEIAKMGRDIAARVMRGDSPYNPAEPKSEEKVAETEQKEDSKRLSRYFPGQQLIEQPERVQFVNELVTEGRDLVKEGKSADLTEKLNKKYADKQIDEAEYREIYSRSNLTDNEYAIKSGSVNEAVEAFEKGMKSAGEAEKKNIILLLQAKYANAKSDDSKKRYEKLGEKYSIKIKLDQ